MTCNACFFVRGSLAGQNSAALNILQCRGQQQERKERRSIPMVRRFSVVGRRAKGRVAKLLDGCLCAKDVSSRQKSNVALYGYACSASGRRLRVRHGRRA